MFATRGLGRGTGVAGGSSTQLRTGIVTRQSYARRFKYDYNPSDDNLPLLLRFVRNKDYTSSSYVEVEPPEESTTAKVPNLDWSVPAGGSSIRNPYAERTVFMRTNVPTSDQLPGSEYWFIEMFHRYDKEWPSIRLVEGRFQIRPGFLAALSDPYFVPYWYYSGLELIRFSVVDRILQALCMAAYGAVAVFAFTTVANWSLGLSIAILVSWAREELSLINVALLLILANSGRMWLYFVFMIGRFVDTILAKYVPRWRNFLLAQFAAWMVYVWLSPLEWYPLPFPPFAPQSVGPNQAFG